ncbi:restriction endonuclease [Comamonas sp. GB3 AK4-5]|uniref:restriction endonuclease n=1 Tax=Comamonas sp. GB3 AK4-5 TaxID=3231487 RepID=UPI00351DD593
MAPNSLFAILLRSRWWISFAVAAVIALLAFALLPLDYKLVGALGATPFFAVGIVAMVRQFNAPSPAKVQALLDVAAQQSWPQFSAQLQAAWQAEGYTVQPIGSPAADFRLERQGKTALVCAKRWKAAHHGVEPLKLLHQARQTQNLQDAVYITLQPLQAKASAFADAHQMVVLQGADLAALLVKQTP